MLKAPINACEAVEKASVMVIARNSPALAREPFIERADWRRAKE
jgi:hypothetical protein